MCEVILTPIGCLMISGAGCWSIACCAALTHCVADGSCRRHRRCRRCIMAAATRATPAGAAGLALSAIGLDLWPGHALAVCGGSLVLGGLAGLSQADWRGIALAWIDSARAALARKRDNTEDAGDARSGDSGTREGGRGNDTP